MEKRQYLDYKDSDIILAASQVKSMAGLLRLMGLVPIGGNYANMKRKLQILKVNCDHWTGCAWNKDQQLKDWSDYTKASNLKKHLIKIRGNLCQECQNTIWLNQPIKLEIHHINGDRTNNKLFNLQLLCPNCHSFTKDFRNPLKGFKVVVTEA